MAVADSPPTHQLAGPEVVNTRRLLESLLNTQRTSIQNVVVGNFPYREAVLLDSPSTHAKRILVPRFGLGGIVNVTTTVTAVLAANEGALGRLIVNYGSAAAILYLALAGDVGGIGNAPSGQATARPCFWLAGGGGAFDGRLASVLYAGEICAATTTGSTTLTVAEF
jgi:hypothetical protein